MNGQLNNQLKRKRDAGLPRILFSASSKTFARIFKEDSLRELKDMVREKLGLPSTQDMHLSYAQEERRLDLEDEGDFDAFYCFAHALALGKVVHVDVKVEGIIPPSIISPPQGSEEPAEKRQKKNVPSPREVEAPSETPSSGEIPASKDVLSLPAAFAIETLPSTEVSGVVGGTLPVSLEERVQEPVPTIPAPKAVSGVPKAADKPKKTPAAKVVETTATPAKKTPAKAAAPQEKENGVSEPAEAVDSSPAVKKKAPAKKGAAAPQPQPEDTDPAMMQGKGTPKSVKPVEKTPAPKKASIKSVLDGSESSEDDGEEEEEEEEAPLVDLIQKSKETTTKEKAKKAAGLQSPLIEKVKAANTTTTEKDKKRKRTSARDEEAAGSTPATKRKKKKDIPPLATEEQEAIVKDAVDRVLAKTATPSSPDNTPEPTNNEDDESSESSKGSNTKKKSTAKKPAKQAESKTPAKSKAEKPKSKAAASKTAVLSSIKSSTNSKTCPLCKQSPGHPPEDCSGVRTIALIKKRITELKREKGVDNSKIIKDLEQLAESKKRGPRGTTPKVAPEQSPAQTKIKAGRAGRASEVTVERGDEGSSNESGSEDDAPKPTKMTTTKVPIKSRDLLMKKMSLDDVISRVTAEGSDSSERLSLEEEEEEENPKRRTKSKHRPVSVSSEEGSDSEGSAHTQPISIPPTIKSTVNGTATNASGRTSRGSDERDSLSVAKLLSSRSPSTSRGQSTALQRQSTPQNISSAPAWQPLEVSFVSHPEPSEPKGQTDEEDDELVSSPRLDNNDLFLPSETQLQFPYSQATKLSVLSPRKGDEDEVPDSESEKEDEDDDYERILPATQPVVSPFPRLTDIQSQRPFSHSPQTIFSQKPKPIKNAAGFSSLYGKDHSESESESGTESESEPEKISHIPSSRLAGGKKNK